LAEKDEGIVEVSFIDEGIAFNPLEAPQIDAEEAVAIGKIGGQGIVIVRKIADEIEYERKDGKNILRIRKQIER
jgi:anti-sigma regulatory factor (Ser/Thr protein kinase)